MTVSGVAFLKRSPLPLHMALGDEGIRQLAAILDSVDQKLSVALPALETFSVILDAYRRHILNDRVNAPVAWKALSIINNDRELGMPHKKLLVYLAQQLDDSTGQHKEVQFSKLVSASKVGKSTAKQHLAVLESKGYVQRRSDGYRTFLRFCA